MRFVADVIRLNGLHDGLYVEPYAGGAAVALELLLCGIVRRVAINDRNHAVHEFWRAVLEQPQGLIDLIKETKVSMSTREWAKSVLMCRRSEGLELAFAMFFLNRTNRSGILNGGAIGGIAQNGTWKLDARYNKEDLIRRIEKIAKFRKKISLSNLDAIEFLEKFSPAWPKKTLVYSDPPYYTKGRELYYNFYKEKDHVDVANAMWGLKHVHWIVSYDDVSPIHELYRHASCLEYTIGYSARQRERGTEAMFFSPGLVIPPARGSMVEISRPSASTSSPPLHATSR